MSRHRVAAPSRQVVPMVHLRVFLAGVDTFAAALGGLALGVVVMHQMQRVAERDTVGMILAVAAAVVGILVVLAAGSEAVHRCRLAEQADEFVEDNEYLDELPLGDEYLDDEFAEYYPSEHCSDPLAVDQLAAGDTVVIDGGRLTGQLAEPVDLSPQRPGRHRREDRAVA